MPAHGVEPVGHGDILRFEEMSRLVGLLAAEMGITKVRLTGGEPLIRKNFVELVRQLSAIEGLSELVLTTNALLLAAAAEELKHAGISRVNISLDTLKAEKFREICGDGDIEQVFEGIRAAKETGMAPVKVNVLLLKGVNDDEVGDFIRFADEYGIEVRFIEFMRIGNAAEYWKKNFMPVHEIAERAAAEFPLEPLPAGRTTVRLYRLSGTEARIGFISGASGDLCEKCNRLRLTADGRFRPCLMSENSVDARAMLRGGASDAEIISAVRELISEKGRPECFEAQRDMYRIGG
jgi:cyclic pyranopterin phosphate synthase